MTRSSLERSRIAIDTQFKTVLQSEYRMPEGQKTKIHPLQTCGVNSGGAAELSMLVDDIFIRQLNLPRWMNEETP